MRSKHIKSVLRRKLDDWFKTIEDENVKKAAMENCLVSGGCMVSLLTGEDVNDFDIYFRTRESALAIAKYYVKKFAENPPPRYKNTSDVKIVVREDEDSGRIKIYVKSAGIASESSGDNTYQYFEDPAIPDENTLEYIENVVGAATEIKAEDADDKKKYRPVFLSANAITLSQKIQIIIRFYGEVDDIHKNYDYLHCTCSYDYHNNRVILPAEALESIINKQLIYVGSKYPLCSVIRMRKFLKKGWHINAGQILKMCFQVSELDMCDVKVLEDQLTGVDTAYFRQVIEIVKNKASDPDFKLESAYLCEIVDKIF